MLLNNETKANHKHGFKIGTGSDDWKRKKGENEKIEDARKMDCFSR